MIADVGALRTPPVSGRAVAGAVRVPPAAGLLPGAKASVPTVPTMPPVTSAPARDARLQVPRLHVDARVVPVDLRGHVMQVPRNPAEVGWWRDGAVPGAGRGSAVLVGHVNYAGTPGAFAALPRLRPGDRVALTRPDVQFRVVAVRTYPKRSGIPPAVFAPSGPAQLVLITCGGSFDRVSGNYRDNVVAYAQRR